ncbi:MAG: hypothetical protein IJY46_03935 [Lentisphaeria bacterium]|nr:hypothetical protein [Lentisphaeria bacterium]
MDEFTINCPQCQGQLQVSSELIGQNVSCPFCNHVFQINQPQVQQPMPTALQQQPFPSNAAGTGCKLPKLNFIALGIAALALIITIVSFFVGGEPQLKFSDDPEKAMIEYWSFLFKSVGADSVGNNVTYFSQKYGKEYVSNMKAVEIKTNGNYAIVFCKTSFDGKEKRIWGLLRKNSDGYWIASNIKDAKKEISSSWCDEMERRAKEFMGNYGIDFNNDI